MKIEVNLPYTMSFTSSSELANFKGHISNIIPNIKCKENGTRPGYPNSMMKEYVCVFYIEEAE